MRAVAIVLCVFFIVADLTPAVAATQKHDIFVSDHLSDAPSHVLDKLLAPVHKVLSCPFFTLHRCREKCEGRDLESILQKKALEFPETAPPEVSDAQ